MNIKTAVQLILFTIILGIFYVFYFVYFKKNVSEINKTTTEETIKSEIILTKEDSPKDLNNQNKVSVSALLSRTASLKFKSKYTDPNITVWGSDENYIFTSGYQKEEGRNFSIDEINFGRHVPRLLSIFNSRY